MDRYRLSRGFALCRFSVEPASSKDGLLRHHGSRRGKRLLTMRDLASAQSLVHHEPARDGEFAQCAWNEALRRVADIAP